MTTISNSTRSSIRVAAAQFVSTCDLEANLAFIRNAMHDAHEAGCAILACHEGALTGYQPDIAPDGFDEAAVHAAEQQVHALADKLGLAVLVGSMSRDAAGRLFNDVAIISETGQLLGRYAKTWRAGEPVFAPGTGPVIFELAGITATAIICHDLRYPELVRLPVIAGARVLFIINNESGLVSENKQLGYRSMQIARATENGIFAVMANAAADPHAIDSPHQSHGHSKIVDPLGNVLEEAGAFEHRLVIADLNLEHANAEPPLRTVGRAPSPCQLYGNQPEHPAYARWMRDGLPLVHRLTADQPVAPLPQADAP